MRDLAVVTALSASRTTRLVSQLQARGLLSKRGCAEDGRGCVASLTPAGLAKLKAASSVQVSNVRSLLFDHVDPATTDDAAQALSKMGRKSGTLRALAERFVDGRLSEKAFPGMTDQEIEAALTDVPGIGPWTARGFLLVALNRPDVFLTGDVALIWRRIQREYAFDHLPTDEELVQLSDRWRPYRSLAVSYLFASEYGGQGKAPRSP